MPISPYETVTGAIKALKIPRPGGLGSLYVEYRTETGFDDTSGISELGLGLDDAVDGSEINVFKGALLHAQRWNPNFPGWEQSLLAVHEPNFQHLCNGLVAFAPALELDETFVDAAQDPMTGERIHITVTDITATALTVEIENR